VGKSLGMKRREVSSVDNHQFSTLTLIRTVSSKAGIMNQTVCLDDYSFGPQTSPQCRDGLDLTLVFEESILSLLPASLMIIGSTARCIYLSKARRVVPGKSFYDNKAVSSDVLISTSIDNISAATSHGSRHFALRPSLIMVDSSPCANIDFHRGRERLPRRIICFCRSFQIRTCSFCPAKLVAESLLSFLVGIGCHPH
jgi:hypothetical protein